MRRIFNVIAGVILTFSALAQAPQKMSYQAVIRNSSDQLVINHAVGMRISILQGSSEGTVVYKEIYNPNPKTNGNGLVTIEIGGGVALTGIFSDIDWSNGPYFIKTETDPLGGTAYDIEGTSELLSVPYALFSSNGTPGPQGIQGDMGIPGEKGNTGIQGEQGFPGEKGESGIQGLQGIQGEKGLTGEQGQKGDKGDPGSNGSDGLTTSVNGVTQVGGAITLTKADIGLGNIDNTSDANKPLSAAVQTSLDLKIDKEAGKSLSSNDYTTEEKTKLAGITGANSGDQDITAMAHTNRVALDAVTGINTGDQDLNGKVDKVDGKGLSTNDYSTIEKTKLSGVAIGAEVNVNADWNATTGDAQILNKPMLAIVATSGNYIDLSNKPITDGSETKMIAGTNITVTGSGTSENPYSINTTISTHYIGELFGGGVVFYVNEDRQHGLICSMVDLSSSKEWSNISTSYVLGSSMWNGQSNTTDIIEQSGHNSSAAKLCDDYVNSDYGTEIFTDWYLPAIFEFEKLYYSIYEINKVIETDGNPLTTGLENSYYWTSTENTSDWSYVFYIYDGNKYLKSKVLTLNVRSIRAF